MKTHMDGILAPWRLVIWLLLAPCNFGTGKTGLSRHHSSQFLISWLALDF